MLNEGTVDDEFPSLWLAGSRLPARSTVVLFCHTFRVVNVNLSFHNYFNTLVINDL